jgi:PPIC-type PPIASE domain
MNLKLAAAILVAVIAGIGSGLLACRSITFRDALGRVCGRGHLLALVQTRGIYKADVERAAAEFRLKRGPDDLDSLDTTSSKKAILSELIRTTTARCLATDERIAPSDVEHELDLLRSQFRDRRTWMAALSANGLSERSLRTMIKDDLRARKWIDRQIASQSEASPEERKHFYEQHLERFSLPVRIRVSHLFLAAPPETAPDIVDLKKEKIEALAKRIKAGESFSELVATESEDEASKTRGGDLGYFSAYRMPADFFKAATKVRPGEIGGPIRTALGFHLLQTADAQPFRPMTFAEANQEIGAVLEQGQRRAVLKRMDVELRSRVPVVFGSFGP